MDEGFWLDEIDRELDDAELGILTELAADPPLKSSLWAPIPQEPTKPVQAYSGLSHPSTSSPYPLRRRMQPSIRRQPRPNLVALGTSFNFWLVLGVIQGAYPNPLIGILGFCASWSAALFLTKHVAKSQEDATALFIILLAVIFVLWILFSVVVHAITPTL